MLDILTVIVVIAQVIEKAAREFRKPVLEV